MKDREWCLRFCQAAWQEWERSAYNCMYKGNSFYRTIAEYMEGRQRIDQYKPLMGVDENATDTWLNLNWKVLPIMPKYFQIAMAILSKMNYKIGFVPIDSLATDEKNKYFAELKARLLVREQLQKMSQSPEMAEKAINMSGLEKQPSEPGDMEELEMQAMFTYKHQAAIEMEQDVAAIFSANKVDSLRKKIRQDLFYYGVAGYKDYIDSNGALRIRTVKPDSLIVSPCREKDFSDMSYVGEVLEMSIQDFATINQDVTREECMDLANQHISIYGNQGYLNTWEKAKRYTIRVLDIEWYSVDEFSYEINRTSMGNMAVVRTKKRNKEFTRTRTKVVYKAKWVIGTDYIFDYGRATDMKRARKQLAEIIPSYHLYSPMFHDMKIQSIGQQVIPVLDQIQLDWLKLQQFKAEARPKGVSIEIGALEDVKFGKGGEIMTPRDLFDLFEKKSVLLWRRADRQGKNANMEPVRPLDFGGAADVLSWFQSIQSNVQLLKDIIGLNEFTDASTPDPRSLTTTANLAAQATNNSLYYLMDSDLELLKRLSESVVIRLQDMAELGLLDNYALSIGDNSVNFMKKNPKVSHHDYAIQIREVPTDEAKQQLIADAKSMMGGDLVTYADVVMVKNTDDLKVAEQILAWKIERRKKEKMQESMMLQQQNAEVQMQSSQAAEQAKQQTMQMEMQFKMELEKIKGEYAVRVAEIQAGSGVAQKMIGNERFDANQNQPGGGDTNAGPGFTGGFGPGPATRPAAPAPESGARPAAGPAV